MDIASYQHMRISTRGKRPLRNLTPGDKVQAIQRIHNGETKASVSRDIGVPESTLRGWCKNEQKLRFMCRQMGASHGDQKQSCDNPPQKRSKLGEYFDWNSSYALDHLGRFCFVNRSINIDMGRNKSNSGFISKNIMKEPREKNSIGTAENNNKQIIAANALLQGTNTSELSKNVSIPQHLNPSLSTRVVNKSDKYECLPSKSSLHGTSNWKEGNSSKLKTELSPVAVKHWSYEKMFTSFNITNDISGIEEKKDSNSNDLRPLSPALEAKNEFGDLSALFPISMPLPTISPVNLETKSDVLLQWSKVFNATLSFLALATAKAALQYPTSTSEYCNPAVGIQCETTSASFHRKVQLSSNTSSIFEQSEEDRNCASHPKNLSTHFGAFKFSILGNNRSDSPMKNMLSDSQNESDEDR